MKPLNTGKTMLSPLHPGSYVSYELCGDRITIRLLGIAPAGTIRLEEISLLRLAARNEVPIFAFALNWMLFYCWRPAYRPFYLMKTADGKSYFPRLSPRMQKQLLLAMKRCSHPARAQRKAA